MIFMLGTETEQSSDKNNKIIFPLLFILLILSALTIGFYFFKPKKDFQNKQTSLKQEKESKNFEIKIEDGNVVKVLNNDTEILINKNDYQEIEEFISVDVSPDQEKICFLGQSIVPIWLFISDVNGVDIKQITTAENCSWSLDSRKIGFNNFVSDVSPIDVYVYDLDSKDMDNLTAAVNDPSGDMENFRFYEQPVWQADGNTIESLYTMMQAETSADKKTGISLINLLTGEIKEKTE